MALSQSLSTSTFNRTNKKYKKNKLFLFLSSLAIYRKKAQCILINFFYNLLFFCLFLFCLFATDTEKVDKTIEIMPYVSVALRLFFMLLVGLYLCFILELCSVSCVSNSIWGQGFNERECVRGKGFIYGVIAALVFVLDYYPIFLSCFFLTT